MNTKLIYAGSALVTSLLFFNCLSAGSSASAQTPSGTNTPIPGDYVCVRRGPHSRVWQRAVLQTNQSGVVRTNRQSYTELATGLCHLQDGQYIDSVEHIEAVADGAEAIQGRHRVHWAANANSPGGAVVLTTPDDKQLRSSVYGLMYFDGSSGSNVMLTQIQDCTATIIAPNTLIYGNAFSNLTADVRYTYRKAGLSQDIVLKQQPPPPADYGLNPATTRLQVITEFFDPPAPIKKTVTTNGLSDDRKLDFGDMKMGVGHAFLFQNDAATVEGGFVAKHWMTIDNRTFLVEEVRYASISNLLASLHASLIKPDKSRVRRTVWLDSPKPRKVSATNPPHAVKLAKTMPKETGFVLDYELLSSSNNCTFQGDTTYLVTGLCNMSGTTVLEGGTVIKYTTNGTEEIDVEDLQCASSSYRPAVFTSVNDNTVGSVISGSTGNPWGDNAGLTALFFPNLTANLQNVRFSHLAAGVSFLLYDWHGDLEGGDGLLTMSDFQAVDCGQVVMSAAATCYLFNGLVYDVGTLFWSDGDESGEMLTVVNLTVHHCGTFAQDQTSLMHFTNCLFAEVTNIYTIPEWTFTNHTYFLSNDTGVFQTVGAAAHYLADDTYQNAGTTNIDPGLLADLQTKTTYPPVTNFYGLLTNDYTFFPKAQRDNNGSTVDIGYHYDPIDYAIAFQLDNATMTVLPGTALAMVGPDYGIWPATGAALQC